MVTWLLLSLLQTYNDVYKLWGTIIGEKFRRGKVSSLTENFVTFPRRKFFKFSHFSPKKMF